VNISVVEVCKDPVFKHRGTALSEFIREAAKATFWEGVWTGFQVVAPLRDGSSVQGMKIEAPVFVNFLRSNKLCPLGAELEATQALHELNWVLELDPENLEDLSPLFLGDAQVLDGSGDSVVRQHKATHPSFFQVDAELPNKPA
jgi:hypothetical protein